MNNIKTEPSSHDNDDDRHADMVSSSSSSIINTATSIRSLAHMEYHDLYISFAHLISFHLIFAYELNWIELLFRT